MEEIWNDFIKTCQDKSSAENVEGKWVQFCPNIQFIKFDALKVENYPYNLPINSIYLEFKVDLVNKKVELCNQGHIYLSPSDREGKYKYLAMKSMTQCHVDLGGKKFRKCKFKTYEQLYEKLEQYYCQVMKSVKTYTNNVYPYKQGV